ncbi:MAG TPA: glycosyltransferase family 4 protein [Terriglobales bacterium]|nr:glycosyltransferase family 4 protein [Terriglobales bacterium]
MRIVHVNDVASVATTLVAAQRALGHDATLRPLHLAAGSRSTPLKLLALPERLRELRLVNRDVRRANPDVVHIHYAYLGWAGILGRYPYVLHCHGTDVRAGLRDPLRAPLVRRSLAAARAVFVSTPDLVPLVAPLRDDVLFVPNPVDTSTFRPLDGPSPAATRVLLISAFSDVKRVDIAVDAVRMLRSRRPDVQVTAIDRGPLASRYRGEPGVTLVSPRPHAAMAELINEHAIVLGQFGIGSLGMAELEAMACGRPVVCHYVDGGLYAEPPPLLTAADSACAARHIEDLLGDPSRARDVGAHAGDWVRRHHGFLEVGRRLVEEYGPAIRAEAPAGARRKRA